MQEHPVPSCLEHAFWQTKNGKCGTILNEAVNFDKQCIFIAIPKTGSTTIRNQLRQQGTALIRNPHLNITQIRDSLYIYLLKIALGQNRSFPTHGVCRDDQIRTYARHLFDNYFKFSAVRNPWARAVSIYFRRESVQVSNELSFDKFCEQHLFSSDTCFHPTLHLNQYDWLSGEDNELLIDYVYKLEEFDIAINEIARLTNGRISISSIKKNANPRSQSRDYRDLYNAKTKQLIATRFEKDIDYFKYAF